MLRQSLSRCGAAEDCDGAAVVAAATEAAAAAAAALPAVPNVAAWAATFAAGPPYRELQQLHNQQQHVGQQQQESLRQHHHFHDQHRQHGAGEGQHDRISERQQQQQSPEQHHYASVMTCEDDLTWRLADPLAKQSDVPAANSEAPSTNGVGLIDARRVAAPRRKPELQQKLLLLQGQQIAVLCLRFSDRYFLTLSDNGKMSALLQGSTGFEETRADVDVSFLFGDRRREHYLVYARSLLSLIRRCSTKQQVNLLLAISIQDDSPALFKQVIQGIEEHFSFV